MANPVYPNVPRFPGVPPVNRIDPENEPTLEALTKDAPELKGSSGTPAWGIFKGGTLVLEPDSIVAVDYQREFRIADYPIEEGGFESYNKVATPYDIRVTVTKGGKLAERQQFLDTIDGLLQSLELYTIVTPDRSYPGGNIARADYSRKAANGAGMLTVDLHVQEVRGKVSVQFSGPTAIAPPAAASGTTHAPSGANPTNNGSVQALTPAQERLFAQGLPIDIGP